MNNSQYLRSLDNRLYRTWSNMRQRCNNPNRRDGKYYIGKGVTYIPEWDDFAVFADWALSHGYADNLTIERIDGTKGYSPENCRWVTLAEQQRNKSNNRNYTYNGKTQTLAEWAREYGINRATLGDRIDKFGYSMEEALHRPVGEPLNTRYFKYKGEMVTIAYLSKISGLPKSILRGRIMKRGWDVETAVSTPIRFRKVKKGEVNE